MKKCRKNTVKEITSQCGIRDEALKRGLRSSTEVKIARLHKSKEGPKAFSITTQEAWELERGCFTDTDASDTLQG